MLGDVSYGSSKLFRVAEGGEGSITFNASNGNVYPNVLFNGDGSAYATTTGIYVPYLGLPIPDGIPNGNFIYAKSDGTIKDSGVSFAVSISEDSTDAQVPSAAAVYEALTRIAPIWEGIETEEDLIAWQRHNWRDFLPKIIMYSGFMLEDYKYEPFFESNGLEVRFNLYIKVTRSPGAQDRAAIAYIPKFLNPPKKKTFICYNFNDSHDFADDKFSCIIGDGNIWLDKSLYFGYDMTFHLIICGSYPLKWRQPLPLG
jgi:hypothetical protein